jgi:hypothetical protein
MELDLNALKKRYNEFAGEHKLPKFEEINMDFEIDKIDRDSGNFLRLVRKAMMEKIVNSMGFVDMLLNPVNAPRLYFVYIKNMSDSDRETIEKIYGALAELSVDSLELEIDSDENKEAKLIKKAFDVWNSLKPGFRKIMANVKNPIDVARKEKTYFG